MKNKTKTILKIAIPCASIGIITGICLGYMCTYSKAEDVDKYLKNSTLVKVQKSKNEYLFDGPGTKNLMIFYPGAKVDEKAYSPLLHTLASLGIDCYLTKMPFHMAIFNINKANDVIKNNKYDNYYLSGHSMGGAMAASYVSKTTYDIKGLVFFAAYSATDLKAKEELNVLSIYGSNDGVLQMKKLEKGREYMPNSYSEIVIDGGNHAQFGSYGKQKGDKDATISPQEQLSITTTSILAWMAMQD